VGTGDQPDHVRVYHIELAGDVVIGVVREFDPEIGGWVHPVVAGRQISASERFLIVFDFVSEYTIHDQTVNQPIIACQNGIGDSADVIDGSGSQVPVRIGISNVVIVKFVA
jgi:hypothetical protein